MTANLVPSSSKYQVDGKDGNNRNIHALQKTTRMKLVHSIPKTTTLRSDLVGIEPLSI